MPVKRSRAAAEARKPASEATPETSTTSSVADRVHLRRKSMRVLHSGSDSGARENGGSVDGSVASLPNEHPGKAGCTAPVQPAIATAPASSSQRCKALKRAEGAGALLPCLESEAAQAPPPQASLPCAPSTTHCSGESVLYVSLAQRRN